MNALILGLVSIFLFVGCGGDKKKTSSNDSVSPTQQSPEVKPSPEIQKNFRPDNTNVKILREAFEKEHLLRAQVATQLPVPMLNGLKSRVVAFRQHSGKVFMLEAVQGHTVSTDVPQNLILTSFPIVNSDSEGVTINFNAGMNKVFYAKDWDFYDTNQTFNSSAASLPQSYIKNVESSKKSNAIIITQVATVNGMPSRSGGSQNLPIELKYYLTPYIQDNTYKPVLAPVGAEDMNRYGFFKVAPTKKEGYNNYYATRFHPNKPIVFAVSPNTPDDFKQAVKDGVLYWNKAFKTKEKPQDVVQVVEAPAGVYAPDADYNVVQWMNWDAAGFAYADAQADPRTGQTLNAQVVMTSVFGTAGKKRARSFRKQRGITQKELSYVSSLNGMLKEHALGLFELSQEALNSLKTQPKSLVFGFDRQGEFHPDIHSHKHDHTEFCRRDLSIAENKYLAMKEAGKHDLALKIAQDYVREVVAHEIGHTLGLRHNFAASLSASYPQSERDKHVTEYLKTGQSPDIITASSVMEYQLFEEASITGAQMIIPTQAALDYDRHVIQKLYLNVDFPADKEQKFLFCTDDHVGYYADCHRFDIGRSPVEWAKYGAKDQLRSLPYRIVERFVQEKINAEKEGKTFQPADVVFSSTSLGRKYVQALQPLADSLIPAVKLIRLQRKYPKSVAKIDWVNIRQQEYAYLDEELKAHGGYNAILDHVSMDSKKKVDSHRAHFKDVLSKFKGGESSTGKKYAFSEKELAVIEQLGTAVYLQTLGGLPLRTLITLGNTDLIQENTPFTNKLADYNGQKALAALALKKKDEEITISLRKKSDGQVMTFKTNEASFTDVYTALYSIVALRKNRNPYWTAYQADKVTRALQEAQKSLFNGLLVKEFEIGSIVGEDKKHHAGLAELAFDLQYLEDFVNPPKH